MTKAELHELDTWLAEHFFKQQKPPYVHSPHVHRIQDGIWICTPAFERGDVCEWQPLPFSSDPTAFALVKREIESEQRGWQWAVAFERLEGLLPYTFEMHVADGTIYSRRAESEQLAGCLAVKAAMKYR